MDKSITQSIENAKPLLKVVAFVLLGMLVGAMTMNSYVNLLLRAEQARNAMAEVGEAVSVAEPAQLRISAVGLEADFEGPLGLNLDQTIEVPESYEELGWYQHAPLPGELGPAVILGHVDSYEGPAVFYPLKQTSVGDIIEIERVDGSLGRFTITDRVERQQSDFPTELVYGDIDHAGLRLITCSGTYDHGKQVYSHNLIVFAELLEEIPAAASTDTQNTP